MTFPTEQEAQREIAEDLLERIQQFLAGERSFDEAVTIDDFILAVDVWPDGSVSTEDGSVFDRRK